MNGFPTIRPVALNAVDVGQRNRLTGPLDDLPVAPMFWVCLGVTATFGEWPLQPLDRENSTVEFPEPAAIICAHVLQSIVAKDRVLLVHVQVVVLERDCLVLSSLVIENIDKGIAVAVSCTGANSFGYRGQNRQAGTR
jgi:hypothetical protein